MDNKTQRTIKSSMILYDLGYKWSTLDTDIWMLHNEVGDVVCTVNKIAFPSHGTTCKDFTHKCLILLPSLYETSNFSILFSVIASMCNKYGADFNLPSLAEYGNNTPEEYVTDVIDECIECIFEEI